LGVINADKAREMLEIGERGPGVSKPCAWWYITGVSHVERQADTRAGYFELDTFKSSLIVIQKTYTFYKL